MRRKQNVKDQIKITVCYFFVTIFFFLKMLDQRSIFSLTHTHSSSCLAYAEVYIN